MPEDAVLIACAAVCALGLAAVWLLRPGGWLDRRLDGATVLPASTS